MGVKIFLQRGGETMILNRTPSAPHPPHTPQALPSLKWIILVMLVTGYGLDFDLCSSKPKIKESI